jgi:hypothetical protein
MEIIGTFIGAFFHGFILTTSLVFFIIILVFSCYKCFAVKDSYIIWPVGQAVKTPPFHGGNTGSNPVRVIKEKNHLLDDFFNLYLWSYYLHDFCFFLTV